MVIFRMRVKAFIQTAEKTSCIASIFCEKKIHLGYLETFGFLLENIFFTYKTNFSVRLILIFLQERNKKKHRCIVFEDENEIETLGYKYRVDTIKIYYYSLTRHR